MGRQVPGDIDGLYLCALIIQKVISNSLDITNYGKKFFQLLLEQSKQGVVHQIHTRRGLHRQVESCTNLYLTDNELCKNASLKGARGGR